MSGFRVDKRLTFKRDGIAESAAQKLYMSETRGKGVTIENPELAGNTDVGPPSNSTPMAMHERNIAPNLSSHPAWFSPIRLLLIFCFVNLFVYLDRGLIASNGVNGSQPTEENPQGSGIQGEMGLTYFQDGLLPAAFMVGLLIASPVFAEMSKTRPPFKLLAIGMGIWCLACLACAAAPSFAILLLARAAVGVGEASFVALAQPFIDDYAPVGHSNLWFAAFNLCVPVGFASGYILGGLVAANASWRLAFVIEALPMIPFVLFAALSKPLRLKGGGREEKKVGPNANTLSVFWADVRRVLSLQIWLLAAIAYTFYVAVLGAYAYWDPQAGHPCSLILQINQRRPISPLEEIP